MGYEQKLIVELASQFMCEVLRKIGPTRDLAYSNQCIEHARNIVWQARRTGQGGGE